MLVKWRRAPTTRPMTTRRQLSGITVGSLEFKWNAAQRNKNNIIRTCHIDWKKMHVKRSLNLLSKLFRLRCINTLFLENLDIRHFWLQPCSEIMDFIHGFVKLYLSTFTNKIKKWQRKNPSNNHESGCKNPILISLQTYLLHLLLVNIRIQYVKVNSTEGVYNTMYMLFMLSNVFSILSI